MGDRSVLLTVNSLPHGMPSVLHIGKHVIIQPKCTIYSSIIEDECFIGANSVVMEGCRIESGAIVLPNSVVPPGRIIPAGQVWGGNPVQYVRDALESEIYANYMFTYDKYALSQAYLEEFTPWSFNYLQKEATKDDLEPLPYEMLDGEEVHDTSKPKFYYDYNLV